jgi:hypothetical protein
VAGRQGIRVQVGTEGVQVQAVKGTGSCDCPEHPCKQTNNFTQSNHPCFILHRAGATSPTWSKDSHITSTQSLLTSPMPGILLPLPPLPFSATFMNMRNC